MSIYSDPILENTRFERALVSSNSNPHTENMKRLTTGLAIGIAISTLFAGVYAATASTPSNATLEKRLIACGSIPNGSSLTIVETTRLFIFLPKDYYPKITLSMNSHGASAGWVSNAGPYGYAQGGIAKPNCWSYYLDFELTANNKTRNGTVDIGSKSAFKTVSNYLIHFKVVLDPPDATKQVAGNGNVRGQVLLSPVCPVEHIPPDPACAPKPYKTTIDIWSALTGSSYKRVSTSAAGVFNLSLAPGPYVLQVTQVTNGSLYPRCAEVKFSVVAKKTLKLTVNCDTGIR